MGGEEGEEGGVDFPLELTGLSLSSLKFFFVSVFHLSGPCQGELTVMCVCMHRACV